MADLMQLVRILAAALLSVALIVVLCITAVYERIQADLNEKKADAAD